MTTEDEPQFEVFEIGDMEEIPECESCGAREKVMIFLDDSGETFCLSCMQKKVRERMQ